ncbi:MAG: hypothetical protein KKF41_01825 [Actinobacteria bacterium]|nr:hypothetical protein [Actinomycetota bacterium]MBU1942433.1 hypothetical protein [Actinomycetota bacterium]MBU2686305.1 hypothetical protein [Actinomycetota bacterium]
MALKALGAMVSLPLMFLVPGWVLFRSRLFRSPGMSWPGKALVIVGVSASATSLIALFLAETGHLSIWLLDLVLACVALLARLLLGSTGRSLRAPGPARWELLALIALAVLCAVLFFRPAEYVIGDSDPGYYFNNGYHIAATGSVAIYEESVPSMSDFELNASYSRGIMQFTPFHLRSRQLGKILPLLYHLLPVWIGIFIMLFGRMGGLYVLPVFAMLSMFAVFALGRRYSGVGGSLLAAGLLALFFPQLWFSRYPVSETFTQFFLVLALLFFLQMRESDDRALAVACACVLVSAACARPEGFLVVVPMVAIIVYDMMAGRYRGVDRVFMNALLLGLVYVWLYIKFAVFAYFMGVTFYLLKVSRSTARMNAIWFSVLAVIAAGFVVFNLGALRRLLERVGERLKQAAGARAASITTACKAAFAALLMAAFAYYYFVAPRFATTVNDPHRFFHDLSIFFGGIGIFVFGAAFCLLVLKNDAASSFLLGSVVLLYTVAFTEQRLTSGYLPWLTRRYMPAVVPLLFVGAGYAAAYLWKKNVGFKVLVAGLAAGFIALFVFFAAPVLDQVEYRGIDAQIARLAEQVDGNVVLFTDPFLGDVLGIPLRYQYGVDARVATWLGDAKGLEEMVRKYAAQGKKVLLEGSGSGAPAFDPAILDVLEVKRAFGDRIEFPRLSVKYHSRPKQFGVQPFDLEFFYIEPRAQ